MAQKCDICGGRMRKWSDAFNTQWTCQECGEVDVISKSFKLPKDKIRKMLKGGRK